MRVSVFVLPRQSWPGNRSIFSLDCQAEFLAQRNHAVFVGRKCSSRTGERRRRDLQKFNFLLAFAGDVWFYSLLCPPDGTPLWRVRDHLATSYQSPSEDASGFYASLDNNMATTIDPKKADNKARQKIQ